ncbi:MAG: tRNA uridine-5-carboxymethylaminomethyl(34) synthesis enzyme MnmG, partial [Bacillota bacterium]
TSEVLQTLSDMSESPIYSAVSLADLLKRPSLSYQDMARFGFDVKDLPPDVISEIEVQLKYDAYLRKQEREIEQFAHMESRAIPPDLDYYEVRNISTEAKQKLSKVRPRSLGQASRISGVTPSDITMLMLHLRKTEQ